MAAKDCYASQDGPIGAECVVVDCIASGTITINDAVLLTTAAADNDPRPTVKTSDANDSAAWYGVAAETVATGKNVRITRFGRAKAKVTCSTPAIAVGEWVASDDGGGVKKAASQTDRCKARGQALQAASTQNDEILIDLT